MSSPSLQWNFVSSHIILFVNSMMKNLQMKVKNYIQYHLTKSKLSKKDTNSHIFH